MNTAARAVRLALIDDGNELYFCSSCAFSEACLAKGLDKPALRDLHVLVEHVGPLHAGDHIFREGDVFESIAAVRAGTVKTYLIDRNGEEQVLGFHFPGEIIGLSAIEDDRYPCNAVALDTAVLCRFSFTRIAVLAAKVPGLQKQLFKLMSHDINKARMLSGDHSADERMAAFLLDIARRLSSRGFSAHRLHLTMARADIANYLRLAPETVSRVLRRFRDQGLLQIDRREVELKNPDRLEELACAILRP